MEAQLWAVKNIPAGATLVQTPYVPRWENWPGIHFKVESTPMVSGRRRLFESKLRDRKYVLEYLNATEVNDDKVDWYSLEKLEEFKADFIAVDSLYYERFLGTEIGELYPSIRSFFTELLAENYPYTIVFERKSNSYSPYLYPPRIKPVEENRIVVLAKRN
jgi:hypothetical protein